MVRPGLAAALASGNVTNARVISVNTGRGKDADWAGKLGRTAIDKRPLAGRAEVGRLGLGGDEQGTTPRNPPHAFRTTICAPPARPSAAQSGAPAARRSAVFARLRHDAREAME